MQVCKLNLCDYRMRPWQEKCLIFTQGKRRFDLQVVQHLPQVQRHPYLQEHPMEEN